MKAATDKVGIARVSGRLRVRTRLQETRSSASDAIEWCVPHLYDKSAWLVMLKRIGVLKQVVTMMGGDAEMKSSTVKDGLMWAQGCLCIVSQSRWRWGRKEKAYSYRIISDG
jgi:hypothetical protein